MVSVLVAGTSDGEQAGVSDQAGANSPQAGVSFVTVGYTPLVDSTENPMNLKQFKIHSELMGVVVGG